MSEGSLEELLNYAGNPETCFDRFLSDNKSKLNTLSPQQVEYLLSARYNCKKAESIVSFTRQELVECVKERLLSPEGILAEVYDSFVVAESFFE